MSGRRVFSTAIAAGWLCRLLASYERMIVLKERELKQRQTSRHGAPF
jgi:hypothetical protein